MSHKIPSDGAGMDEREQAKNSLIEARRWFTQRVLATKLGVSPRTIIRWENGANIPKAVAIAIREILASDAGKRNVPGEFTFIDLFAGIGGIRMGFEAHGGRCIYTSEWDLYSQKTYRENFGNDHLIHGDITKIHETEIPDHDVLLAGFPCQPFSIAGVSKKKSLGRAHGFLDETQGTLFFDIARILAHKKPKAFLLENVKNLISHDGGKTFQVITRTLREELGYRIEWRIIDAKHFVPQHRERLMIVGFREEIGFNWGDLRLPPLEINPPVIRDILHPENGSEELEEPFTVGEKARVNEKYILSNKLWGYLKEYAERHKAKGNGFGYGLVGPKDISRTLSARYYKDGSEILVSRGKGKNPRRLTPRECSRLMGFDSNGQSFRIVVSDTSAYKQFGNAVAVPVIAEVARIMKPHIMNLKEAENTRLIQLPLFA
jgi:DNA (cytosine-5)-methyltransferase 1